MLVVIIVIVIVKVFYKPENYGELELPKFIKIPDKSKVDTIDFDNNNINMVVTLEDGNNY